MKETGIQGIVNDDLIDSVMRMARLMASLTVMGIVGIIAHKGFDMTLGQVFFFFLFLLFYYFSVGVRGGKGKKLLPSLSLSSLPGPIFFSFVPPPPPWKKKVAVAMIVGFVCGYFIMTMATVVVDISSATIFICFAMHPMGLGKNNHT